MKKLTLKQSNVLCECGHIRHEHADEMEGNGKVIKKAVGFCLESPNGFDCKCLDFRAKSKDQIK